MVVLFTVPAVRTNVMLLLNPLAALVDASKPVGGVTVISLDRLAPDTLKDVLADAVP